MRILLVHNYYRQPGGEDSVFHAEKEMLLQAGHDVVTYTRHNDEIARHGLMQKMRLPIETTWAQISCREIKQLIESGRPEVAHFHNTFPLVSPAAYYVCKRMGVPVVQTLHNPRLMCPAATLYRDDHLCQDCVGKLVPWPGMVHGCYRHSRAQTSVVAMMLAVHRLLGTWDEQVAAYIVSTEFYQKKFIEARLPPEKIVLKPHFVVSDPGPKANVGSYAIFVGRLSPEKGVLTLIEAWEKLRGVPLKIRGEGMLMEEVRELARKNPWEIELLPPISSGRLMEALKGARFLVWPSGGYYETFGLIAIEAFACGVPVIASGQGAMAEIVDDGRTGLHFTPGDAVDLAAKVEWAWTHPAEMEALGRNARAEYEAKYTIERNYEALMNIYTTAINNHQLAEDQAQSSSS